MKKNLIITLVLGLLLLTGPGVSAGKLNNFYPEGSAEMEVELMPGYMLEVPAGVDIPYNQEDTDVGTVCVSMMVLEPGKQLKIRGELENLKTESGQTLPCTMDFTDVDVTDNRAYPIRVHIGKQDWADAPGGAYQANMTFWVEMQDAGSGGTE